MLSRIADGSLVLPYAKLGPILAGAIVELHADATPAIEHDRFEFTAVKVIIAAFGFASSVAFVWQVLRAIGVLA